MTDWNKMLPCKSCYIKPKAKCNLEFIKISCPICGRSSSTSVIFGTYKAIDDWNKYQGVKNDSLYSNR